MTNKIHMPISMPTHIRNTDNTRLLGQRWNNFDRWTQRGITCGKSKWGSNVGPTLHIRGSNVGNRPDNTTLGWPLLSMVDQLWATSTPVTLRPPAKTTWCQPLIQTLGQRMTEISPKLAHDHWRFAIWVVYSTSKNRIIWMLNSTRDTCIVYKGRYKWCVQDTFNIIYTVTWYKEHPSAHVPFYYSGKCFWENVLRPTEGHNTSIYHYCT